jgi:hypothetical protein
MPKNVATVLGFVLVDAAFEDVGVMVAHGSLAVVE